MTTRNGAAGCMHHAAARGMGARAWLAGHLCLLCCLRARRFLGRWGVTTTTTGMTWQVGATRGKGGTSRPLMRRGGGCSREGHRAEPPEGGAAAWQGVKGTSRRGESTARERAGGRRGKGGLRRGAHDEGADARSSTGFLILILATTLANDASAGRFRLRLARHALKLRCELATLSWVNRQRRARATPCASAPCMPVVCSAAARARGPPERAQSEWSTLARNSHVPRAAMGAKVRRQRCAFLSVTAAYTENQKTSLRAWSVWRAAPLIAKPRPTCGLAAPHAAHIARISARESVHTEASGRAWRTTARHERDRREQCLEGTRARARVLAATSGCALERIKKIITSPVGCCCGCGCAWRARTARAR